MQQSVPIVFHIETICDFLSKKLVTFSTFIGQNVTNFKIAQSLAALKVFLTSLHVGSRFLTPY